MVVNNQSGGGVIAAQTTARAAPDGYTLMRGYVATHGTSPATRKLSYDPIKDFKPFACGIVIHPSIDACTQLRAQGVTPEDVTRIDLRVHPLVLELTGKKMPQDGLQGKFSVYHGCAVGLIFGRAGEEEFSDHIVRRDDVVALRDKINAVVAPLGARRKCVCDGPPQRRSYGGRACGVRYWFIATPHDRRHVGAQVPRFGRPHLGRGSQPANHQGLLGPRESA